MKDDNSYFNDLKQSLDEAKDIIENNVPHHSSRAVIEQDGSVTITETLPNGSVHTTNIKTKR